MSARTKTITVGIVAAPRETLTVPIRGIEEGRQPTPRLRTYRAPGPRTITVRVQVSKLRA